MMDREGGAFKKETQLLYNFAASSDVLLNAKNQI